MHTLYDSDFFSVTHMSAPVTEGASDRAGTGADTPPHAVLIRHGFEIVDKRSGKEVYLDGSWAELFQERIVAWQRNAPTEEEVEETLAQYAGLAQTPVAVH